MQLQNVASSRHHHLPTTAASLASSEVDQSRTLEQIDWTQLYWHNSGAAGFAAVNLPAFSVTLSGKYVLRRRLTSARAVIS